ncbi:hypothetical protein [Sphingomonas hankyongi]|uniref:Uncharacterized protein n=1 Tax=Sphingomonas hankyongi TaxID=2908209 RepID=A0ABT0S263_9SPHN|nr:hypothetical protein [Sphingomonas hankyongi]MCL6729867.1 hypothetical protein [Sphingomonas hankyongi]
MFRMLKLRPPHGWRTVLWELAIVTLGVLIALAAQQWAEARSWDAKLRQSRAAISGELAKHYNWSVEWRVILPCLVAQTDRLRDRVERSGSVLQPAPLFSEAAVPRYTIRLPGKEYSDAAWQAAIADGTASRLPPELRRELADHYTQAAMLRAETQSNLEDQMTLQTFGRPLLLDAVVRFSLIERLERLRGRVEFMDVQAGQLIDHIQTVGMVPRPADAVRDVERFGTYKFCKSQGLPTRSFADGMKAVPN